MRAVNTKYGNIRCLQNGKYNINARKLLQLWEQSKPKKLTKEIIAKI